MFSDEVNECGIEKEDKSIKKTRTEYLTCGCLY